MGEHFLGHLEDLTSCGGALFGAFGGFNILWGSTFEDFWKILRPVGEHFLELLEDFTLCGEALSGTFGGFYVVWGSTFWNFWRILRCVGEHLLGLLEDVTSCEGGKFESKRSCFGHEEKILVNR